MSEILNQRHTFDLIQVELARNREGVLAIQASQEERVRFLVDGIFERQDNI